MKRIILISVIAVSTLFCFRLEAQDTKKVIGEFKQTTINSEVLNETRNIYIQLPVGYEKSSENYIVLYTLYNGNNGFQQSSGVLQQLHNEKIIPKIIHVSVDLGDGRRDLTPTKALNTYGPTSGGAGNYLKFMKTELIPYIEKNYRTNSERIYSSHSIGGTFGIYALLTDPDMFSSVLVSSPWFIYDMEDKYLIKNAEAFFMKWISKNRYLYICVGDEGNLIPSIEEFINIIKRVKPPGLQWKLEKMPEEDHRTIISIALEAALKAKFN
ncbi:alpha/beta hydrolase [Bacteroidota bacterium]